MATLNCTTIYMASWTHLYSSRTKWTLDNAVDDCWVFVLLVIILLDLGPLILILGD